MSQANPDLLAFVILRALTLLIGLAFAWMGYRLFLSGFSSASGDIEIEAGKTFKLKLFKTAPGIFFALAGTGIIIYQVTRVLQYTNTTPSNTPAAVADSTRSGAKASGAPVTTACDTCSAQPPQTPAAGNETPGPQTGGSVSICDTCSARITPHHVMTEVMICDTCSAPKASTSKKVDKKQFQIK